MFCSERLSRLKKNICYISWMFMDRLQVQLVELMQARMDVVADRKEGGVGRYYFSFLLTVNRELNMLSFWQSR